MQPFKIFNHILRFFGSLTLVLIFLFGCDVPERPKQVTIARPPILRPANPNQITSVEDSFAAIISVCRDDLHLSVVDPLQVFLYKNKASLAFYGHGWQTLPVDISNELAFARKDTTHINIGSLPNNAWGLTVGVLAHEYAHTIHQSITQSRPYEFVSEGFAEWVAAKVLNSLKWQDYQIALHRSQIGVLEVLRERQSLPDISSLQDPRLWRRLVDQNHGYIRTYTGRISRHGSADSTERLAAGPQIPSGGK